MAMTFASQFRESWQIWDGLWLSLWRERRTHHDLRYLPKRQRDPRLRGDDGGENGNGAYAVDAPLWLTPLPSGDKGVPIHRIACPAILPARISGKPAGA
ncbi:MAG TPA: hypothetical protein VF509_14945 [Sphingobium sp.]